MRCQRCGFEIEPGQTFCSMCGTEQSKAMREPKKKIKSILGVIKVASMNHLKMWVNLFLMIALALFIFFTRSESPVFMALVCLGFILFGYIFVQCLIPYKNPNASKSKKYKMAVKVSLVLIILLFLLSLTSGSGGFMDFAKSF